ncbi:DUF4932 domain-containing protein [Sphingobacterium siyangense]|uniref:DUF4932 domain-containing protein n=1 Tax=Sphingobacterium siyangense TaxID=459529 RepID=UPI003DA34669
MITYDEIEKLDCSEEQNLLFVYKSYPYRLNCINEHELITFVNKIKNENGIRYDAVMSMAIHLDDKFNLKQKNIDETLDKRWSRANALQFATLLKKFYKDSNSKRFFQDNLALYNEVQKRFLPIYELIELDWYPKFYVKKPSEKLYRVVKDKMNRQAYGDKDVYLEESPKKVFRLSKDNAIH